MGRAEQRRKGALRHLASNPDNCAFKVDRLKMEACEEQGGNDPAAEFIRCETVVLATDLHSFQVGAQPGDFNSIWDTQASASLLKIAFSSADVINDSCSLDASVHSPPLSRHCPATTTAPPPATSSLFLGEGGWGLCHIRYLLKTHTSDLQCNTFIGSATFQDFVMYSKMQVKENTYWTLCLYINIS